MFGFSSCCCLKLKWHKLTPRRAYCFYQLSTQRRITHHVQPPPATPSPTPPNHHTLRCSAQLNDAPCEDKLRSLKKNNLAIEFESGNWRGWWWTRDIKVSSLSTGSKWRLAAITQRRPTDRTATTSMHQVSCCVYKKKHFNKQKPVTSVILNKVLLKRSHAQGWRPTSKLINLLRFYFDYDDCTAASELLCCFNLFSHVHLKKADALSSLICNRYSTTIHNNNQFIIFSVVVLLTYWPH